MSKAPEQETNDLEKEAKPPDKEATIPKQKAKDLQGRKWQITINHPTDKGFDHERIKLALQAFSSLVYACLSDEKGNENGTLHTHVYIACSSPVRFSSIKKIFESAHIERVQGTSQENRDYIAKSGKWVESEKSKTSIEGSFEEFGEMPPERNGSSIEALILERIQDGATNGEIIREFPNYLRGMRDVEHVRQMLREEEFRNKNRDVKATYITGPTGVGKSFDSMKENVGDTYRITDYNHPWDFYAGQSTVVMEEYSSNLTLSEILNILDVYPLILRARYSNKIAMFDKVLIISNLGLFEQYPNAQLQQPEVFRAFLRRIHKIIEYTAFQKFTEYTMEEYKAISRSYRYAMTRLEYRSTTYPAYLNQEVPFIETKSPKQASKSVPLRAEDNFGLEL